MTPFILKKARVAINMHEGVEIQIHRLLVRLGFSFTRWLLHANGISKQHPLERRLKVGPGAGLAAVANKNLTDAGDRIPMIQ
jgi:hypothetical protein